MPILAGQLLTASALNALTGVTGRQPSDTAPVVSSTVLVNTAIALALDANSVYGVHGVIIYDTSSTADYRWSISLPAGATVIHSDWGSISSGAAVDSPIGHSAYTALTGLINGGVGIGTLMTMRYIGTITTAGTAGTATWQHAQGTSTAVNTVTKAGSWLTAVKLA